MVVLYLMITLHAPWCDSLKEKRSEVRKLLARLRGNLNLSACESHMQDRHRTIGLTVASLAFDHAQGDSIAQSVIAAVESTTDAEITQIDKEYR